MKKIKKTTIYLIVAIFWSVGALGMFFPEEGGPDLFGILLFGSLAALFYFLYFKNNKTEQQVKKSALKINEYELKIKHLEKEYEAKKEQLEKEYLLKNKDTISKEENLSSTVENYELQLTTLTAQVDALKNEKRELEKDVNNLDLYRSISYLDFVVSEDALPVDIKNELEVLKSHEKQFISALIESHSNKKIDIETTSRQMIRVLLRLFESESETLLDSLTLSNVDNQRARIVRSYETVNNLYRDLPFKLDQQLLDYKLQKLALMHEYQKRQLTIKEQQKAIKEQMLEEEKVRREIEYERQRIIKEERQFKSEVDRLMKYLGNTDNDIEKQLYIDKIRELEQKINILENDKNNVDQRELNTRAGFVYIISNIGSFGENIYKIGVTRRLEPMNRVKELGSASVPFEFDVHAMIFSDDAPKLENILHTTFRDKQVNKVNDRKEFFKVTLSEIEDVVIKNHNATVIFTELAKAEQYRETLRIEEQIQKKMASN